MTPEEQIKQLGKALVPFMAAYIATHLAAARFQAGDQLRMVGSIAQNRRAIVDEAYEDALHLLKAI